jgi:hypothetical protein
MNDKEIKDLMLVIKCLTLQMVDVREELAAMRLALTRKHAINVGDFEAAQDSAKSIWDRAREEIRKIGMDQTVHGPMQ